MFAKTRKRQLIDLLHENGLCICYNRVLRMSNHFGEAVIPQYVEEAVVCQRELKKHVFTTPANDNIDHNPTSTMAQSSIHGTSVSLFQHPSSENPGEECQPLKFISNARVHKIPELPESITNVKPAFIPKNPRPSIIQLQRYPAPESISHTLQKSTTGWRKCHSLKGTKICEHHIPPYNTKARQTFEVSFSSLMPLL